MFDKKAILPFPWILGCGRKLSTKTMWFQFKEHCIVWCPHETKTWTLTSTYLQCMWTYMFNKWWIRAALSRGPPRWDRLSTVQCSLQERSRCTAHSNSSCSEIIALNICEKCERSVISKANLKKHIKNCKGKKKIPEFHNGDQCRWFKNDKCKFTHLN